MEKINKKLNFAIGITTFKKRFKSLSRLVCSIRNQGMWPIILAINGEHNEPFDEQYRQDVLDLAAATPYCNVFMFPQFRSLSKLWNTILQTSPFDWNLILNDDVHIAGNYFNLNNFMNSLSSTIDNNTAYALNGSWSHFIINKKTVEDLGWFDERLLGIGEEDSDMFWRYLAAGNTVYKLYLDGVMNLPDGCEVSNVKSGVKHYSKYNMDYILEKYKPDENGIEGMFENKKIQVINDINFYPGEMIYRENKDKLSG